MSRDQKFVHQHSQLTQAVLHYQILQDPKCENQYVLVLEHAAQDYIIGIPNLFKFDSLNVIQ